MQIMHFRCCRICRTESNLKFTIQQLREIVKSQRKNGQKLLLAATPTLGNICHSCEEQLQNYHHLDEGEDSEVDVDDVDSGTAALSGGGRAESPIIVDDNDLLYDLFFQKTEKRRSNVRKNISKRTHRPNEGVNVELTQHSLGSDGDTEIIEVLTSRESTPAPTPTPSQLTDRNAGQKIVAVIDLEFEEEHPCENLKSTLDDGNNDEIVFCCVEPKLPTSENNSKKAITKCTKKTYAESELRLIASLSLVSSDSEADEVTLVTETKTSHQCKSCIVHLPDADSMLVHERIHTGVICPVCKMGFTTSQRLVHHMRFKHRSYDGEALSERPRCAQDSAMTIRLRYLQRYTYYECQLCGRIDAVFKEHKQHVMQSHAAESKSLKDPMMKELKCPVCKEACGMQHLMLCRHLLSSHTAAEYRPHLREVRNLSACGWSASRQRDLVQTSRVYQLPKRKNYFFECKQCSRVVANYLNHKQHLNTHERTSWLEQKSPKGWPDETQSRTRASRGEQKSKVEKLKSKALKQVKPAPETPQILHAKQNKKRMAKLSNKALQTALTKVKPLRRFPAQKYTCQHCQLVCTGFYRLNLHTLIAHANMELPPTCRQSFATKRLQPLQKETSQYKRKRKCSTKADYNVTTPDENCNIDWKRARIPQSTNAVQSLPEHSKRTTRSWLHDLMQLSNLRSNTASETVQENWGNCGVAQAQCCYCTHLFTTFAELAAHEQVHREREEIKSIKRHALQAL